MKTLIDEHSDYVFHTGCYAKKARIIFNLLKCGTSLLVDKLKLFDENFHTVTPALTLFKTDDFFVTTHIVRGADNEILLVSKHSNFRDKFFNDYINKIIKTEILKIVKMFKDCGLKVDKRFWILPVQTEISTSSYDCRLSLLYEGIFLKDIMKNEGLSLIDFYDVINKRDDDKEIDPFIVEMKRVAFQNLKDMIDIVESDLILSILNIMNNLNIKNALDPIMFLSEFTSEVNYEIVSDFICKGNWDGIAEDWARCLKKYADSYCSHLGLKENGMDILNRIVNGKEYKDMINTLKMLVEYGSSPRYILHDIDHMSI